MEIEATKITRFDAELEEIFGIWYCVFLREFEKLEGKEIVICEIVNSVRS